MTGDDLTTDFCNILLAFEADADDAPNELADVADEVETTLSGTARCACCDLPLLLPLPAVGDATDGTGALADLASVGT